MTVEVRDWFGWLELYFVVEKWRPVFARFNRLSDSGKRGFGVYIVDREFWSVIEDAS